MNIEEEITLWDGVPPGSEGWTWDEREVALPGSEPGDAFVFLLNVVRPTLTPVLPDPADATGTAVIVCPGGAYSMLAIEHEGFEVARWLAERGIAAFVLKYRVMEMPEGDHFTNFMIQMLEPEFLAAVVDRMDGFADIPLADAVAAMRHVRDHAVHYGLEQIGVLGFSAGARLALDIAGHDDRAVRPDFVGAIYGPGASMAADDAPPLFLAAASDDPLFDGSVRTHAAWRDGGRPVEAHLYARGGHGFGMRTSGLPCDDWIEQFHSWMYSLEEK